LTVFVLSSIAWHRKEHPCLELKTTYEYSLEL
jgi:hypothetical protein